MKDLHSIFAGFKTKPQYRANTEVRAVVDGAEEEALALEKAGDLKQLDELIRVMKNRLREILAKKDRQDTQELNSFLEDCKQEYLGIRRMYEHYNLFIPGTDKIRASNGREYSFPTWPETKARIQAIPDLEAKLKQMQMPVLNITALISLDTYITSTTPPYDPDGPLMGPIPTPKELDDTKLRYDLKSLDPNNHGGITKSELATQQNGFIVSIDEAKIEMESDPGIPPELSNSEKQAQYFDEYKVRGTKGLICEQWMCLALRALHLGVKMDEKTSTYFTNTLSDESPLILTGGFFYRPRPRLVVSRPEVMDTNLRSRSSIWAPSLDEIPPLKNEQAVEILDSLETQYYKRLETLDYFEFFEPNTREITAIDGQRYRMPIWDEIRSAITPDHLQKIKDYIPNPHLLIVPIGMPLMKIAQKVSAKNGKLAKQEPVYRRNWDIKADLPDRRPQDESLRYFVEDYTPTSGVTKSELLDMPGYLNNFPGWQVLVVSGDKKVNPNTTDKLAGEILQDLQLKGLSGLTPDEWLLWHADNVRDGVLADVWAENSATWNGACYLTKSENVPEAGINKDGAAVLGDTGKHDNYDTLGVRPAVRIF